MTLMIIAAAVLLGYALLAWLVWNDPGVKRAGRSRQ